MQGKAEIYIIPFRAAVLTVFSLGGSQITLTTFYYLNSSRLLRWPNLGWPDQSAFYFGYFIIPIPAGILMKTQKVIKQGLLLVILYALGAALFWPAAEIMNHLYFSWPIYYCSRIRLSGNCRKPFCYGIRPESRVTSWLKSLRQNI